MGLIAGATRGLETSAIDYIGAQLNRAEISGKCARFFESYDLLLTPSVPLPAFEVGYAAPQSGEWGKEWTDWTPFSYPFNVTQQPAASIPCGMTRNGLPSGLQIIGAIGADALVLRASRAFEAAKPYTTRQEPRTH